MTHQDILAQAQTTVTDVLRQLPGIQIQVAGAPGQIIYPRLRGFSDSTLYVFDGITMNSGGAGDIGYLLGQLDPTMVQDIQVLRGPRATTYGANTTSGVIDFTTLEGAGRAVDVSAEGGSLDYWKVRVGVQDKQALGDGSFNFSLNGSYLDSMERINPNTRATARSSATLRSRMTSSKSVPASTSPTTNFRPPR